MFSSLTNNFFCFSLLSQVILLSKFFIMCIKRSSLTAKIEIRRKKSFIWSTPGLDFINILRTAFTPVVPQSVRTQSSRQYLFTLLGPTSVKAVRRTLMKLTPGLSVFLFQLIISFFVSPYRPLSHKANFHYCQSVLRGQWLHSIMKQDSWMWKRVIVISINILI